MLCQWTADACGFKIEVVPMDVPTLKSEPYLKMHINQKAPALLTQSGVIVESATIARYMARSTGKLYGADPFEHAQVDQWLDYFTQDLLPLNPLFAYQSLGYMKPYVYQCKQTMTDGLNMFKTKLEVLNKAIEKKEYFVGSELTIADIVIFAALYWPFSFATSDKDRKPYPHLMKWYLRMGVEEWFLGRSGKLRLCSKPFPVQQLAGDDAPKDAGKKKAAHKEKGDAKKAAVEKK
jgi:glutathione S-transferase